MEAYEQPLIQQSPRLPPVNPQYEAKNGKRRKIHGFCVYVALFLVLVTIAVVVPVGILFRQSQQSPVSAPAAPVGSCVPGSRSYPSFDGTFTGTFFLPGNCSEITIDIVGGGGGGGGGGSGWYVVALGASGGGGGGAGRFQANFTVNTGDPILYNVGSGGIGGSGGAGNAHQQWLNGNAGSDSTVTHGGVVYIGQHGNYQVPGAGGTGGIGTTNGTSGSPGQPTTSWGTNAYAGGGDGGNSGTGTGGGSGGAPNSGSTTNGARGYAPGGGGGGGNNAMNGGAGGTGANGVVIFSWEK